MLHTSPVPADLTSDRETVIEFRQALDRLLGTYAEWTPSRKLMVALRACERDWADEPSRNIPRGSY